MTTKEELKKIVARKKKLSGYTYEEKEFAKELIEQVNKLYYVGIEERQQLEEKFLKVIRRNNV